LGNNLGGVRIKEEFSPIFVGSVHILQWLI